jgi:hypothetical protein
MRYARFSHTVSTSCTVGSMGSGTCTPGMTAFLPALADATKAANKTTTARMLKSTRLNVQRVFPESLGR